MVLARLGRAQGSRGVRFVCDALLRPIRCWGGGTSPPRQRWRLVKVPLCFVLPIWSSLVPHHRVGTRGHPLFALVLSINPASGVTWRAFVPTTCECYVFLMFFRRRWVSVGSRAELPRIPVDPLSSSGLSLLCAGPKVSSAPACHHAHPPSPSHTSLKPAQPPFGYHRRNSFVPP